MKKRAIVITACAAALVIAFVLLGLPPLMRLMFGRSQQATMLLWQFHKERYTTEEAFDDYLKQKRMENSEIYAPPLSEPLTVTIGERWSRLMPYYLLNAECASERLIVYFPGGSYIDQPTEAHWRFAGELADRTDSAVVVPLYPKLPDADASEAYEELAYFFDALKTRFDPNELIFMGDSAGGGMALSFAMQLRDRQDRVPDKLILICPWLDVTLENPDVPIFEEHDPALDAEQLRHLGTLWAGELTPYDPVVSPMYGHCDGIGSITLVTTTDELLYPDIKRLDAILTVAGIEHTTVVEDRLFHIWPLYAYLHIPESEQTLSELADIITGQ